MNGFREQIVEDYKNIVTPAVQTNTSPFSLVEVVVVPLEVLEAVAVLAWEAVSIQVWEALVRDLLSPALEVAQLEEVPGVKKSRDPAP